MDLKKLDTVNSANALKAKKKLSRTKVTNVSSNSIVDQSKAGTLNSSIGLNVRETLNRTVTQTSTTAKEKVANKIDESILNVVRNRNSVVEPNIKPTNDFRHTIETKTDLPTVLSADVATSFDSTKTNVDWEQLEKDYFVDAMFHFNHNLINKVEILYGFNGSKENWQKLTSEILSRLQKNSNYLCRLIPYENSDLGIVRYEGLELPIFDEYFILTSRTTSAQKTIVNSTAIVQAINERVHIKQTAFDAIGKQEANINSVLVNMANKIDISNTTVDDRTPIERIGDRISGAISKKAGSVAGGRMITVVPQSKNKVAASIANIVSKKKVIKNIGR